MNKTREDYMKLMAWTRLEDDFPNTMPTRRGFSGSMRIVQGVKPNHWVIGLEYCKDIQNLKSLPRVTSFLFRVDRL